MWHPGGVEYGSEGRRILDDFTYQYSLLKVPDVKTSFAHIRKTIPEDFITCSNISKLIVLQ